MLCLNSVKPAANKPRVIVDTPVHFTHVAGCLVSAIRHEGLNPYPS